MKWVFILIGFFLITTVFFCILFFDQPKLEEHQVMAWDIIDSEEDNEERTKKAVDPTIDILSPTWIWLEDTNGKIKSLVNTQYITWAHEQSINVWAMVSNQKNEEATIAVLSDPDKSKALIEDLTSIAYEHDLDGLNIDFEYLNADVKPYFSQFIAELYSSLKPLNVTLSVDVSFPSLQSKTVDFNALEQNTDFVIFMAYDQHYEGGPVGSVASLDWVDKGIKESLEYVPSEKIILGSPLYVRIWEEKSGKQSSWMETMVGAYDFFENRADIWQRDNETGQIYTEYHENGTDVYKAWLEDTHSFTLRMEKVKEYNLYGTSLWSLGMEDPSIWSVLKRYFPESV